jgi:hypothetical protein
VIANEDWRNDPARREAAEEVHRLWTAAAHTAGDHLDAAVRAFDDLPKSGSPIRERVAHNLRMAKVSFDADFRFVTDPPTDVLIGNMAAFGVGADLLEREGEPR